MPDRLKSIINREKYTGDSVMTHCGSSYICKTGSNDYLHVAFYGITEKEENKLVKNLKKIKKDGPHISEICTFLKKYNGCILFGGSLNLFGYDDGKRNEEDRPSSILDMNMNDYVSKSLNKVVYIGNMPYIEGGNINLYLNLDTGLISGYYDGQIVCTWVNLDSFLDEIVLRYDTLYGPDGKNVFFGQKDHGVYNNIQKYTLKETEI